MCNSFLRVFIFVGLCWNKFHYTSFISLSGLNLCIKLNAILSLVENKNKVKIVDVLNLGFSAYFAYKYEFFHFCEARWYEPCRNIETNC